MYVNSCPRSDLSRVGSAHFWLKIILNILQS